MEGAVTTLEQGMGGGGEGLSGGRWEGQNRRGGVRHIWPVPLIYQSASPENPR